MGYHKAQSWLKWTSIIMHNCTEMYSEPEIQNLDDLKPEPERSSWRRDEKVNADSEASIVRKDYVELFSVKVNLNLKVFCILCLCIILCDTSKASENLTFILKQSLILSSVVVVIYICGVCAMKMKESAPEIALDIAFISKLWFSWGTKWSFWCRGSFKWRCRW